MTSRYLSKEKVSLSNPGEKKSIRCLGLVVGVLNKLGTNAEYWKSSKRASSTFKIVTRSHFFCLINFALTGTAHHKLQVIFSHETFYTLFRAFGTADRTEIQALQHRTSQFYQKNKNWNFKYFLGCALLITI